MTLYADVLDAQARAAMNADVAAIGFAAFGPALDAEMFASLRAEADAQRAGAWGRAEGKTVDHRNKRANLGPLGQRFLAAPETQWLLADIAGTELSASFEASCYTYYEGPGDFLAPHLDRPEVCAYTLIVYLDATWPPDTEPGPGLALQVFAGSAAVAPEASFPTRANVIAVGRGAEVWHGRAPLREGERVVALTACYAAAPSESDAARRAAILVAEGFAEYQGGDMEAARRRFETALQIDATLAEAWSGLGFVEWSASDFSEALHRYRTAAHYNPADPSIWSNIGLCLRDLKAFERAEHAFAVALMLDPGYAPAWNEWGNVLQDQGRPRDAIELYMRSLAIDGSRAVVHHNLGVAYNRLGERMLALHSFSAALDRDPNYTHSLEEVGLLCAAAGIDEEARTYLARAGTERALALLESLGSGMAEGG